MDHYHAWLRSGKVFTMAPRLFNDRTTAHKWATRKRSEKGDRLVLGCSDCPTTAPSKRKPPRWGAVARDLAERFGLQASYVREALAAALETERGR